MNAKDHNSTGSLIAECNRFLEREYAAMHIKNLIVLEAGGGSSSHFPLPAGSEICTVDISWNQLIKNCVSRYKILADVHDCPVGNNIFDIIICFNVLEHLRDPEKALIRLTAALKKDGLLIIGFPDRNSLKGLITRFTPHVFHQWYCRVRKQHIQGKGSDRFKTYLHKFLDRKNLISWLDNKNLKVEFSRFYNSIAVYDHSSNKVWKIVEEALGSLIEVAGKIVSLGKWAPLESDIFLVVRNRQVVKNSR